MASLALCSALLTPAALYAQTVHEVEVTEQPVRFIPDLLTIQAGDTVRWVNAAGGAQHDVVSEDDAWEPPMLANEFIFEVTFPDEGVFDYFCTPHRNFGMVGTITVEGSAAQIPPMADFTSSCTDLVCSFTDQSSDSDGTIASWSWDFGDGAMSSMQNPGHTYASAGTFPVSLTVTDNDGDSDTTNKNVTVTEAAEDPIVINAAMSDAWFFPDTSGQGFFIIVWEDQKLVFLAWFTYDTERPPEDVTAILGEPGHRWLTALGPYDGDSALLDVFLSSGMIFDSGEPEVTTEQLEGASIWITWSSCEEGVLTYDIPSLGLSGDIPIQRIVDDNVAACEAAQAQ